MPFKQWSVTEMPRYRRDLVAALEHLSRSDEQVAAFDAQAASRAELFWVTPDMTSAALDASVDLPDWAPGDAAPCDMGLLMWGKSLPSVPAWGFNNGDRPLDEPPISGIYWRRSGGKFYLATIARTEHLSPRYLPVDWQVVTDELLGMSANARICLGETSRLSGLFAAIGATWLMMQQPGIGATRTITGAGGSSRSWTREERTVVLIDLGRR